MNVFQGPLPTAALFTTLAMGLSACIPERLEERLEDPLTDAMPNQVERSEEPRLPASELDYVTYANTNLPSHFTNGPNNPLGSDNTPVNNPITNAGATLGRVLFYDNALSINDTVSCASCHSQETGFSDHSVFSEGFQGGLTGRHSMSLSNNRFYESGHYFWDERADTLEDQVLMPIQDSVEMGMTLDALEIKLAQLDYYPSLFKAAFGSDQITSEKIGLALAQFVRAMVSYQSKYDMALSTTNNPDDLSHVLNATEEAGRRLFELPPPEGGLGCAGCHDTVAQVTDKAFNIGLDANTLDEGAGNGEFKVPSLRNIEVGAPYMHDGRFATLAEVIEHYNSGVQDHPNLAPQLRHPANNQPVRLNMSNTEKVQLEAFLNTLTDNVFLTSELFSDPF